MRIAGAADFSGLWATMQDRCIRCAQLLMERKQCGGMPQVMHSAPSWSRSMDNRRTSTRQVSRATQTEHGLGMASPVILSTSRSEARLSSTSGRAKLRRPDYSDYSMYRDEPGSRAATQLEVDDVDRGW